MLCRHVHTKLVEYPNRGRVAKDECCVACNLLRSDLETHMRKMPHDFNPDEMDEQTMEALGDWHRAHHQSNRWGQMVTDHDIENINGYTYLPVKDMVAELRQMAEDTA